MAEFLPERLELLDLSLLRPAVKNARVHTKKQEAQIARQISRYGFLVPIVVDENNVIMGGHGRLAAAKLLGMVQVPCVRRGSLSDDEKRAYALADNAVALKAGWDKDILATELRELMGNAFTIEDTGFELVEVDQLLSDADDASVTPAKAEDRHQEPSGSAAAVSRMGDVWRLGHHRLINGDAKDLEVLQELMNGDEAAMVFSDPPTM